MMKTSTELEQQAAHTILGLMTAAARTAPKTRGVDNIRVLAVDDAATKQRVADRMREIAARENRPFMARDAGNLERAAAALVVGVEANAAGIDCGYCGHPTCRGLEAAGGVCAFNSMDLGIAACSAAAVANLHHVDNRIMFSIGRACLELQLFDSGVKQALGIPLSITGKNPFFDRQS